MPLMAYSTTFAVNVLAGYGLTVLGALLALAAGVWWMMAGEWAHGKSQPMAFRGLSTLAFVLFTVGLFWQLFGYIHLNYTSNW